MTAGKVHYDTKRREKVKGEFYHLGARVVYPLYPLVCWLPTYLSVHQSVKGASSRMTQHFALGDIDYGIKAVCVRRVIYGLAAKMYPSSLAIVGCCYCWRARTRSACRLNFETPKCGLQAARQEARELRRANKFRPSLSAFYLYAKGLTCCREKPFLPLCFVARVAR
jgi:hypothetical protein